jgi:hypothetical protein
MVWRDSGRSAERMRGHTAQKSLGDHECHLLPRLALPLHGSAGGGLTMELTTGLLIGAGLFLLILVPYLALQIRRGKAHGHTRFTWFKPRGHSDIGPDVGVRYTKPGVDEAKGLRH